MEFSKYINDLKKAKIEFYFNLTGGLSLAPVLEITFLWPFKPGKFFSPLYEISWGFAVVWDDIFSIERDICIYYRKGYIRWPR